MPTKTIITLFFPLFVFSCNHNQQKNIKDKVDLTEESAKSTEEKLHDRFINKKLESINEILSDRNTIDDKKILLIYTGFDCQSCVDKGYLILKSIKSQDDNQKIFIISTNANIGGDQERNEFYDFVFNDKQELIRTELKFIYTPVIIVLDKENRIVYLDFPKTNTKEQDIIKQIEKVISK